MEQIPAPIVNSLLVVASVYAFCSLISRLRRRLRFIRMVNALPGPCVKKHKHPILADLGTVLEEPTVTPADGIERPGMSDFLLKVTKQFHGNGHGLVRLWSFHPHHTPIAQTFVVPTDADCIMDILKQYNVKRDGPSFEKPLDEAFRGSLPMLGPSMFTLPDGHAQLKLQRKAGTPTASIVEFAHNSTCDLIKEYLFPFWDAQAEKNNNYNNNVPSSATDAPPDLGVDLFVQAKHLMMDISCMMAVSKTFDAAKALRDGNTCPMYQDISCLDAEAGIRSRIPLRNLTHFTKFNRALKRLNKFFADAVAERKRDLTSTAHSSSSSSSSSSSEHPQEQEHTHKYNRDLLSAFLKAEEKMEEGHLLGNLRLLLYAAFDSTASIFTWALWELATRPEYQQRLYEEIKPLGANPSLHDLAKCVFLNQIINETLRLYSPVTINRRATRDFKIGRGDKSYIIPKGCALLILPVCVNRLSTPDNPDADKFIPDREISKKSGDMRDDAYARNMVFSLTPRQCLGSPLAMTEARASLATILYNFKVTPMENAPQPKLIMSLNFNPHNVFVNFQRRKEH